MPQAKDYEPRLAGHDQDHNLEQTVWGYARVSTREQTAEYQLQRLRAAGVPDHRLFVEHASGAKPRPRLEAVLDLVQRGDVFMVTRADRIGRNMTDLHRKAELLEQRGVHLVALDQPIDTRQPMGKLQFAMIAAMAEYYREEIRERCTEGLAAARVRGVKIGPKFKLTPIEIDVAVKYRREGKSMQWIAREFNVSRQTIMRAIARREAAHRAEERTIAAFKRNEPTRK